MTRRILFAVLLLVPVRILTQTDSGVITGRIVSLEGTPVAGVRVAALTTLYPRMNIPSQAETDRDGRYRLEGIPAGEYFIVADPFKIPSYYPGTGNRDDAKTVTLSAGSTINGLDFRFVRMSGVLRVVRTPTQGAPRFSGVLHHTSGKGLPNIVVRLLSRDSGLTFWTVTNASGSFEFSDLQPGVFTMETNSPDLREEVKETITLRLGEHLDQEVGMRVFGNSEQRPDLYAHAPREPRVMALERNASSPGAPVYWRCQKLDQVHPKYPQAAQDATIKGSVEMKLGVDADGKLLWMRVASPDANPEFARAAVEAVRQWTFTPLKWTRDSQNRQTFNCTGEGEAVPFQGSLTFNFPYG